MQAQTESLLFILTVINGRDLVSSRCNSREGRKKNAKSLFSLLLKFLCARQFSFSYSFHCDKWGLGTNMAAASPKKSHSDIQQNTDPVSHELSKWPISPYEFTVGTFFFSRDGDNILVDTFYWANRCVNVKANTKILTKPFFSLSLFPVQSPRLYSSPYESPLTVTRRQQSLTSPGSVQLWSETAGMNLFFKY